MDALSLLHGGWAACEPTDPADWPKEFGSVTRCLTAGDQPDYLVFEDGSVFWWDSAEDETGGMSAERVQELVYGIGVTG